jgi:hypothetical protein
VRICQKGGAPARKIRIDAKTSSISPIVFDFADDMNMKLDCLLSYKNKRLFIIFRSVKLFDDSSSSVAMKLWDSSLIRKYSPFYKIFVVDFGGFVK